MKKYFAVIAAITIISLTSCYVRVRERHPHPKGVIILSGDNTALRDSAQAPVISEPAK